MNKKLLIAITSALALSACNDDGVTPSKGNSIGMVQLSGDNETGTTLSAELTDGNGFDANSITYNWMADDVAIVGATSSSYLLTDLVLGKKITVSVDYVDNDGYAEFSKSNPTDIIEIPSVPSEGSVAISGDVYVDFELTATISDDNGSGDTPVTYTWMADGVVIADASAARYMLTADELGKTITVIATYTDNDGYEEDTTSYPTVAVTVKPADVVTTKVATITDNMTDDAGELRYKHSSTIKAGKLSVSFAKDEVITADGTAKEAYIALYGSSTSTSKAMVDLRIGNGTFTIRDQASIDVAATFTPGEWIDVEMTWDASSASDTVAPLVTISINGTAVTTTAFSSVSTDLATVMDGVQTVVFKLSDTSSVVTGAYLVDDVKLYSDIAGTTVAFEDDFESYSVTDSLGSNNANSPYNSSTAEAVVAEAIRSVTVQPEVPTIPTSPTTTHGQYASISDNMTDDAGELRYKGSSMITAGKLTVSFLKETGTATAEGADKDAYIALYGDSTSTNNAIIDLRIQAGTLEVRNANGSILNALAFTLDEWHDVEVTWDASSTTEAISVTLTIDDTVFGPFASFSQDSVAKDSDGVKTIAFKLGDTGAVIPNKAYLIDNIKLYSDIAGTVVAFEDDFEGYTVGDSLDTDNAASPYDSSTAEAIVGIGQ